MATLKPTLTLTSSDMNGDVLNLSSTDSLSILGQVTTKQVVTTSSSVTFAANGNYTKSYVYLKNLSSTVAETILIELASGNDDFIELGAGEFAFFPWSSTHALRADANGTGTPTLEVRIYQEAAA